MRAGVRQLRRVQDGVAPVDARRRVRQAPVVAVGVVGLLPEVEVDALAVGHADEAVLEGGGRVVDHVLVRLLLLLLERVWVVVGGGQREDLAGHRFVKAVVKQIFWKKSGTRKR